MILLMNHALCIKTVPMIVSSPVVFVVMCSKGLLLLAICCYVQCYAATIHCYAAIIFILRCSTVICTVLLLCAMLCCNNTLPCCNDLYFEMFHCHMHCSVAMCNVMLQ